MDFLNLWIFIQNITSRRATLKQYSTEVVYICLYMIILHVCAFTIVDFLWFVGMGSFHHVSHLESFYECPAGTNSNS